MNHFDLKLLNIFGKTVKPEFGNKGIVWEYNVKGETYQFPIFNETVLLKIADYGTSECNRKKINEKINLGHVKKEDNKIVHNTGELPTRVLFGGNKLQNKQFLRCVGTWFLCVAFDEWEQAVREELKNRYEEILEEVKCPETLQNAIMRSYRRNNKGGTYDAINQILSEDSDRIILHTIYRVLVLFGIPTEEYGSNAIMRTIRQYINCKIKAEYDKHRGEYSIEDGTNYYISRARERINSLNFMKEFRGLFNYNASKRIKYRELIDSELFSKYKVIKPNIGYEVKSFSLL